MEIFKKAKQNRVFDDVVDQVEEAIIAGKLQEGSKLPPERSLQEIFGVSRGTLREALRVLEHRGLLRIQTGTKGGAFIESLSTDQISDSLGLLIRYRKVSFKDLGEFREEVEGIVAALAVERADEEGIDYLKQLLAEVKSCLNNGLNGWDGFIESDNRFHLAVASMTKNLLYQSVLKTVYDNIARFWAGFLPKEEWIMEETYRDLKEIAIAIEKGEAAKTRSLVQNHVRRFNLLMEGCADKEAVNLG